MRSAVRWTTWALLAVTSTACVPQGLSFRVDKRVHIESPKDRSEVSLPITLTWTVHGFPLKTPLSDKGGSFAVFIDTAPMPPGKGLAWIARDDPTCTKVPTCPDAAYLADHGVYETTQTSLVVKALPPSTVSSGSKHDRHRAVIVLLDDNGKRLGETAFDVTFDLKKKD